MTKLCVCECVEEEAGGGGEEATRDTESKTRTPHKVVGKKKGTPISWTLGSAKTVSFTNKNIDKTRTNKDMTSTKEDTLT